jgi:iron complex transport system ATP-binding protein
MAALAGPNGSGKTTLLRLLSGVLRPSQGSVSLDGRDLRHISERERARLVAVVPQHLEPHLGFQVEAVVEMGRSSYAHLLRPLSSQDRAAVRAAMDATGVSAFASRIFNELSGGEQQRVMLAMALAQQTDYLLLDEPTVHLDLHHQHSLLELLVKLRGERGIGVLAVMHDLNLSSLYFERLAVMDRGEIVADGAPNDILQRDDSLSIFGAPLLRTLHPQTGATQVVLERESGSDRIPPSPR